MCSVGISASGSASRLARYLVPVPAPGCSLGLGALGLRLSLLRPASRSSRTGESQVTTNRSNPSLAQLDDVPSPCEPTKIPNRTERESVVPTLRVSSLRGPAPSRHKGRGRRPTPSHLGRPQAGEGVENQGDPEPFEWRLAQLVLWEHRGLRRPRATPSTRREASSPEAGVVPFRLAHEP